MSYIREPKYIKGSESKSEKLNITFSIYIWARYLSNCELLNNPYTLRNDIEVFYTRICSILT